MNMLSFLFYCFIVTFTPGPSTLMIFSITHQEGTTRALRYTYGATLAFGLLLTASATLNGLIAAVLPSILLGMQIVGSLYMLYLAYQISRKSKPKKSSQVESVATMGTFKAGFITQFVNPKVILFTMTVIPTFIMPYYSAASALLTSVLGVTLIGFLAYTTWVMFGTIFKRFLQRHQRIANLVMTVFLLYAAVMMWV
ncbi:LysE family translocator [Saccharibacillus sp. JS10]|uniref:LysE family translocator n=1 Tax=Saccharibacillus sp. JS10 TaxID=2950552 RepID=UPI00210AE410|nr:LysE family translocator [Saccharibacillus sp. JS10]MCQ4085535.1 LysE family translocator [Saccharibacillus sp. JS10]